MSEDFDPAQVPIRPAATVMLIRDTDELQVLMMRRHAKTIFAGGMWVFPGGAVDEADFHAEVSGRVREDIPGRDQVAERPNEDRAYYVAGIRECFEECGELMTTGSGGKRSLTQDALTEGRNRLNAGTVSFDQLLEAWQLRPDVSRLHLVARWITPLGSPRRFDARFFIAACEDGSDAVHDQQELVDSAWMSPQAILDAFDAEEMNLMTPTLRMLKNLTKHETTNSVFEFLGAQQDFERVRVDGESRELLLPGELGYDGALQDVETGWVRL
ncbi:MAG: NUDIX hydrolase [Pseudomonadales bacterium]